MFFFNKFYIFLHEILCLEKHFFEIFNISIMNLISIEAAKVLQYTNL
jgi:hypothetical protein